jgi:hypothetical protein
MTEGRTTTREVWDSDEVARMLWGDDIVEYDLDDDDEKQS